VDWDHWKGYFTCPQSSSNWFPTIPDGIATNLPLFPSRVLMILHWSAQTPKPLNLTLSSLKLWKVYFRCFNWGPKLFLTIPDGTTMNHPLFPSGFPAILHWDRTYSQVIYSDSQPIAAVKGGIRSVSTQVPTDFYWSRWHNDKFTTIPIWIPSVSALGENGHST